MGKGWGRFRWLDLRALMTRYMRDQQQLVGIKYFTSPMTHQPDRYERQKHYLKALEVRGGIVVVPGQWTSREVSCPKCQRRFKVPQEKRTDVNLAVHLVADAFEDRFDTFIAYTADSDLVPAVHYVQERFGKRFILIDPPRRHSNELARIADQHLHSRKYYYSQCQLPDPVEYKTRKGRIRRIHRPRPWNSNQRSQPSPSIDGVVHCHACGQPVTS